MPSHSQSRTLGQPHGGAAEIASATGADSVTRVGSTTNAPGASDRAAGADSPYRPDRPHADRAQQFIPFAALKGYYDLVAQVTRDNEKKYEAADVARPRPRERSDWECEEAGDLA